MKALSDTGLQIRKLISGGTLALARGLIRFYQLCLSPLVPPSCRYQPTCSAYALEALERHGPAKGTWLAIKRISRCHPIKWLGGNSGYDPVPLLHDENGTRDQNSKNHSASAAHHSSHALNQD